MNSLFLPLAEPGYYLLNAQQLRINELESFYQNLNQLLDRSKRLTIDLCLLTRVDSVVLGCLVSAMKNCQDSGGKIRLIRPRPAIKEIFRILSIEDLFHSS